jgi:ribosomal protein S6
MRNYEGVFIFPPDVSADAKRKQEQDLEDILGKFGGTVSSKVEIGKKPLGYEVRKFREGQVYIYDFQMKPDKASGFRKALDLLGGLIKYMITVKSEKAVRTLSAKTAEKAGTPVPAANVTA